MAIFSIDYRLAPGDPFPAAVNDCWQAYYWIVHHCEEAFGVRPRRIVLTGDSAGGNLCLAVAMIAVQKGFYVPDGLVIAYPVIKVSMRTFTPSILLSIDDMLLPSTFLKMCLDAYDPEGNGEYNHFLSPGLCPS